MDLSNEYLILITSGIFTLIGVILGGLIPILKDVINRKMLFNLERVKIHDRDRLAAYKRLYLLIKDMRVINYEKNLKSAEKKDLQFLNSYAKRIFEVISDTPYFTKPIRVDLNRLNSIIDRLMFNIMDIDNNIKIIESELDQIMERIERNLQEDFKVWS